MSSLTPKAAASAGQSDNGSARAPARCNHLQEAARAARLTVAVVSVLLLLSAGASGASSPTIPSVPHDFLGVVDDYVFNESPYWKTQTLETQRRSGVELLRQEFSWAAIEPRPGVYRFAGYDALMAATARAGMRVLAVVDDAPSWAVTKAPASEHRPGLTRYPPRSMSQFAQFAALLARRYGPDGTFWRANPKLPAVPIASWEIWNEPNFDLYWGYDPSPSAYAAMLHAVAPAIRAVDPNAEIVTAGVANTTANEGIPAIPYLTMLARAHPQVDTFAIHAYAKTPSGVIDAVRELRSILNNAGLRSMPIWLTEFGWASGGPPSDFTVSPQRQASYVFDTIVDLTRMSRTLRVRGLVYYDWQDEPIYAGGGANPWGFHTGLVTLKGQAKPALSKYYQAAGLLHALPAQSSH
jgi:hypothetical protein